MPYSEFDLDIELSNTLHIFGQRNSAFTSQAFLQSLRQMHMEEQRQAREKFLREQRAAMPARDPNQLSIHEFRQRLESIELERLEENMKRVELSTASEGTPIPKEMKEFKGSLHHGPTPAPSTSPSSPLDDDNDYFEICYDRPESRGPRALPTIEEEGPKRHKAKKSSLFVPH